MFRTPAATSGARRRARVALGCLLVAGLTLLASAASGGAPDRGGPEVGTVISAATDAQAPAAYGRLPLSFVPNAGQLDRRVRYSAQAGGAGFYFTRREAVFSFAKKEKGLALRLGFLSANPRVRVAAQRQGRGRVNYLLGNDSANWRTNLPTYGEVVYRDLWPGIDLVFRGGRSRLEYELHVAPGASLERVRLAYRGASGLSLDRAGNLRIRTALGTISDSRPVSYQEQGGRRVPVASGFLLGPAEGVYGFTVPAYDRSRPLVIDPGLLYSTYLGGSRSDGNDGRAGIAVDSAGNAYVSGSTDSLDFPTTAGAFDRSSNGVYDAFVAKLNASGSALLYSTYLGGSDVEWGGGIAVDGAGAAYITGLTGSEDFPTTAGAFDTSSNGDDDVFVAKLNASGSALVYSTYLGGSYWDHGNGIAVDGAGSAYVTGSTYSEDFPTTAGAFDTSYNGDPADKFVARLNASGSALVYSTYLGGSGDDYGYGIAVDGAGGAYLTGATDSEDFPTTGGAFDTSHNDGYDAFVAKLNASGSALIYSTFLGGIDPDNGDEIAVDGTGAAYVAGSTYSADFPTTAGGFDTSHNGHYDAFVAKLNASGSALLYSTYLGGSIGSNFPQATDYGNGIAIDGAGAAYVTGLTASTDFPTTVGAFDTSSNGYDDVFVAKLNASGSALLYSTYLGGSGWDQGYGIAVNTGGGAYVTGVAGSENFPTTAGAFDTSSNGDYDAFVTKLDLILVDVLAPNTRLTKGPRAKTTSRTAKFFFKSTEAGSKFECKLDRGKFKRCTSPKTYKKLKKGKHTFQVRAIDAAGNKDKTPVKKTWWIR